MSDTQHSCVIIGIAGASASGKSLIAQTIYEELVAELGAGNQVVTVKPSAIACVIGSNIAIPGMLARAAQALADANVNVNAISQTLRQVNMQFIVDRDDYKPAIKALNQALCVQPRIPVPLA